SYVFDLENMNLFKLVRSILDRTDVPRVRISSLQPQDISEELLELWSDPRLCPHFHVPLQSGSDSILKKMRRRYTSEEFQDSVRRIKRHVADASVTADVIVGFPGESDRDFRDSVDACIEAGLASAHVFPYSTRPGTSAAYFEGHIEPSEKSMRVRELSSVVGKLSAQFREASIGQTRQILWETSESSENGTTWTGLTDNYLRARGKSEADLANRITVATLEGFEGQLMRARISEV
ncbi:MAG: radical SAM protein, partial [Dehalococcoidia bacterium]|nr:radical SAM protein [Dehalococcoidia bacterium]